MSRWPKAILIGCIRLYQRTLSPLFRGCCRFEPSCSRYMIGAIEKYGVISGVGRGVWRLMRCHPWQGGGYDPP